MRRDWKRLRLQVAAEVDAIEHDPAMHQVRKDAKRLRYAAEALEPVWGKDAVRLTKAAKRLTAHLGDRQDTVVEQATPASAGAERRRGGRERFVWGRLHAHEQAQAADVLTGGGPRSCGPGRRGSGTARGCADPREDCDAA